MKIERVATHHLRAEFSPAQAFAYSQGWVRPRTEHPFREQLSAGPLGRVRDIIQVPARPGLGFEVDRSFLARHRVG